MGNNNKSFMAPVNGAPLLGADGASGVAIHDPVSIIDSKQITLQAKLNGTLAAHCTVVVKGRLRGGRVGETIVTFASTGKDAIHHVTLDNIYDELIGDVTAYSAEGLGSQVLISARK